MGNGNLSQATRSRVAEDGRRSAQLTPSVAEPMQEPIFKRNPSRPIVGDRILRFLVRTDLSSKALAFFTEFIKLLNNAGSTLVLSPDGTLRVYNSAGRGSEQAEIGRFDESFQNLSKIVIDSRALFIGEKTQQEFSELALAIILTKSGIPVCIRNAFISESDEQLLGDSDGFVLTLSQKMSLMQAKFLRGEEILLYLNVEGMREMGDKSWLLLQWGEAFA
jgi:hypothetical protein